MSREVSGRKFVLVAVESFSLGAENATHLHLLACVLGYVTSPQQGWQALSKQNLGARVLARITKWQFLVDGCIAI